MARLLTGGRTHFWLSRTQRVQGHVLLHFTWRVE